MPMLRLEGGTKQQAGRNCAWKSSASVVRFAQVDVMTMSTLYHLLSKKKMRILVAWRLVAV
jgi:hypothetical protein